MFKFVLPLSAVLAISLSGVTWAEESGADELNIPMPESVTKCYESLENEIDLVDCTHLEADHWENQINVLLRKSMAICAKWGVDTKSYYPEYGRNCHVYLQSGYKAWLNYKQTMLESQCNVHEDAWSRFECATIRVKLAKDYYSILNDYYIKRQ